MDIEQAAEIVAEIGVMFIKPKLPADFDIVVIMAFPAEIIRDILASEPNSIQTATGDLFFSQTDFLKMCYEAWSDCIENCPYSPGKRLLVLD